MPMCLKTKNIFTFIYMKRITASMLLLIFGLNIFGYYGVFMGARFQMVQQIRERFAINDYQHNAEVTIKVLLTMPYTTDTDYERVDGEFNYQGNVYRLVKQKLMNDTLYVVCIKDAQANKIDKALEDYVKTFTDNPSNEKNHSKTTVSFTTDYNPTAITNIQSIQNAWEFSIQWTSFQSSLISSFQDKIIQPPRA